MFTTPKVQVVHNKGNSKKRKAMENNETKQPTSFVEKESTGDEAPVHPHPTTTDVVDRRHTTPTDDTSEKNLDGTVARINQQFMALTKKYRQSLADSEGVDDFYEARIDEMIKEALEVEQALISQKNNFIDRLKGITQTLKTVNTQK